MASSPTVATVLLVVSLAACGGGDRKTRLNVRPPAAGVPQQPSEITGIYRTTHQATLQLRGDGSLSMIVPVAGVGPTAGTYQLDDDGFRLRTVACGDTIGTYRVEVRGRQVAGEANLVFITVDDACEQRSRYLTIDPWYYADS